MQAGLQDTKDIASEIAQDKLPQLQLCKQILEQFKKEQQLIPENNWKQTYDKNNVKGHRKEIKDALPFIRSEGVLNYPAQTVIELVRDLDKRQDYDEIFESGKVVENIHNQLKIIYIKNKGKFLVSGRDFVQVTYSEVFDGVYYQVSKSIESDKIPPVKGVVRAELKLGCWAVKPLSPDSCNVIFMVNFDPKGDIPDMIKNSVLNQQTEKVEIIKKCLDKKKKK